MSVKMVVVGSVAYDAVATPADKRERALGGAAVYFSTVSSFFTQVGLVGVAGTDFAQADIDWLKSRKVDLDGFTQVNGKTFFWSGSYGQDFGDATTHATELNVFESFDPKLPPAYVDVPYLFLANIHPALQLKVIEQVKKPKLIALDTMNFWIGGFREALLAAIKKVDVLFVNKQEALQLAGETKLVPAYRKLLTLGPKRLVVKLGELGALTVTSQGSFMVPAFPLDHIVDPTGAGDSFGAGFMGCVAESDDVSEAGFRRAMTYGSATGSITCENFSIDSYRKIDRKTIDQRQQAIANMLRLDPK